MHPSVTGMVYLSADQRQGLQARTDGLSITQQAPYLGWEDLLARAREGWAVYRATIKPLGYKRLTVKYVNSVSFPLGIPLPDLFNTYPTAPDPDVLFEALSMHYRIPVDIPFDGIKGASYSVLMVNLGSPEEMGKMLLDNTLSVPIGDEETLWNIMPAVRKIKNDLFESQLKPMLRMKSNV